MPGTPEQLAAAISLHIAGRLQEAEQIYRQILSIEPNHAGAWHLLGVLAHQSGRPELAVACISRAIELNGGESDFHSNLGNIFRVIGKPSEAVACCRRALELDANNAEAHNNLGGALYAQGEVDEAIRAFQEALRLNSELGEAHHNLGAAMHSQGLFGRAMSCYDRALQLRPDDAEAHHHRALLWLLHGEFDHGWSEFEWRWKTQQLVERGFTEARWNGESLGGRTILLHAEQGFGDTFQFVRYAEVVKKQNPDATVVVECPPRLARLLKSCLGIDRVIGHGEELPAFDFHLPLLSLPRVFRTTLDTIPSSVPYLFAEEELIEEWGRKLEAVGAAHPAGQSEVGTALPTVARKGGQPAAQVGQGLTDLLWVGINWHGQARSGTWTSRSIPREYFERLAGSAEVRMISLQKVEEFKVQGSKFKEDGSAIVDLGEFDTDRGAFVDTAAIMMNLDLVITSDTSVAHLAGALGVPVWLALPFVPDWRWLLDRSDSPWYPTMRLFRQKKLGDWEGVFEEIRAALSERVQSSRFKVQG